MNPLKLFKSGKSEVSPFINERQPAENPYGPTAPVETSSIYKLEGKICLSLNKPLEDPYALREVLGLLEKNYSGIHQNKYLLLLAWNLTGCTLTRGKEVAGVWTYQTAIEGFIDIDFNGETEPCSEADRLWFESNVTGWTSGRICGEAGFRKCAGCRGESVTKVLEKTGNKLVPISQLLVDSCIKCRVGTKRLVLYKAK
ncbi:matrix protein [Hainan black-spectacled toad rhabdovirus]|uniref:Matrix protein n=1 Tax=Hainan black-spectacled toad rhabdovirus TaxID=2847103 RepID=A0A2P1GMT3_9RHAB|nr:matrix protein [Hainan black-spectacled toad rhabdovirus]AVM87301.1 matrix protein [Hainan black-spectacled toad rhabdovirus]